MPHDPNQTPLNKHPQPTPAGEGTRDEHERSLIAAEVEPWRTDASTPLFIMVRNLRRAYEALTKERDDYEKGLGETIDQRDAYQDAVAKLDIATGGDGEYGWSSDGSLDDTPVAKCRSIGGRYAALAALLAESQKHVCSLLCPSVRKTTDGPWPHVELCQRISAALAQQAPSIQTPDTKGDSDANR